MVLDSIHRSAERHLHHLKQVGRVVLHQPSLHQLYEHILQLESTMQQLLADRECDHQRGLEAIDVDQRLIEHTAMIQCINAQITSLQRDLSRANGSSSSRSSEFSPHAPSS